MCWWILRRLPRRGASGRRLKWLVRGAEVMVALVRKGSGRGEEDDVVASDGG